MDPKCVFLDPDHWSPNWPIVFIGQYKYLQSCEKRMSGGSIPIPVSVMRQHCKVWSTEKWFSLFSTSALLRWDGLLGGNRSVLGRDLTQEMSKTAQFICLYSDCLSLSWEIGICIFCFQCQRWLPGTAASLGRALKMENQGSTEELLITADRQIGFWRTTHGLSTLVLLG